MRFAVNVTEIPSAPAVALDDLKAYLRVDIDDDDDLITSLGAAAERLVERTFDVALMQQTLQLTIDRFPRPGVPNLPRGAYGYWWERIPLQNLAGESWPESEAIYLPRPPLQSVSSITYTAMDGTSSTMSADDYVVDMAQSPGRVTPAVGQRWPFVAWTINAVVVTYVAGYASAGDVPATIKTAVKLMVLQWYDNRRSAGDMPDAARRLLLAEWDGEYY